MSQVDKRPLECLIKSIRTNCELAATVGENDCVYGNERGKRRKGRCPIYAERRFYRLRDPTGSDKDSRIVYILRQRISFTRYRILPIDRYLIEFAKRYEFRHFGHMCRSYAWKYV